MTPRSFWQLGCITACLAAAACGNGTSNGNTPPVTGGGDDASPDHGTGPMEAGPVDGPTDVGGDGASTGDAANDSASADGARSDGASTDGSATDGSGSDGSSMDAGLSSDAPPPAPDGGVLCPNGETWGPAVPVLTTAAADATIFGAVTPDQLTLAWASSNAGIVSAWYADRASTGVSFGAPQALTTNFGAVALDRVSLSGDGLRIVGISGSGTGFVAVKRAARGGAFDTDDSAEFAGLGGEGPPKTYATPLLSPDDALFDYIVTSATANQVIYEAPGGPPWTPGGALAPAQLARVGTQYRRPSGMSMDELSLFYWDETMGSEYIAYRSTPALDYSVFVNIGALMNAVPMADCSRIYYSVPAIDGGPAGAITIVYADGAKPDD
jgi:hypothetical protein